MMMQKVHELKQIIIKMEKYGLQYGANLVQSVNILKKR